MIRKLFLTIIAMVTPLLASAQDAKELVKEAIDYWRDASSISVAKMTVHRPDWSREMALKAWTQGNDQSLVVFTAPAKDAGSASLRDGKNMWSFSPKVQRVIKIPPSMMTQSWMGSDLSYNDLTKARDLIDQYTHKLLSTEKKDGHTIYLVESIPLEDAPVVWGKETLNIRDDKIILQHDYYDQDGKLVKRLVAAEIAPLGGKLIAKKLRMSKIEEPESWTEIDNQEASFGVKIDPSTFTLARLSNPTS